MLRYARVFGFLAAPYLLLLALLAMPAISWAQNANDGFDPNANSTVYALAEQSDGKTLVVGTFTTIAGQTRNHLARLNVDGSLDASFAATDVDNTVNAIVVQADGRIVIGGIFAQVGTYVRHRIARLNANGSVDTAFDPNANYDVNALAVQPDGKLVVGGQFISLSPNGGSAVMRNSIARLNADGSVDAAFNPNANSIVRSIALQPDGKLVLGGDFTALSPNGGGAIASNRIARLNSDGNVDTAFNPNPNGPVSALALQPDGKLVLGGTFTSLSPNGSGAVTRNRIARLNADGTLDAAFNPNANSAVLALALQPDGNLILGGQFTSLSPNGGAIVRNRVARLTATGSVDTTFDPSANNTVFALALQSDGKLVLGGFFGTLSPNGSVPITRNRIARLNADGSVDTTSNPNANASVDALAMQPDGKLLLGGDFTTLSPNGGSAVTRNHIARLNADGSVDMAFNPNANANSTVYALAVQPDGKLVVAGDFTSLSPNGGGAITRNRIARLNADGSLDMAYDPNADESVFGLTLQPDGKMMIGGAFHSLSPNGSGAIIRNHIARLNADGSLDTTFNPNANDYVATLALQPDGKLLVGGGFTSLSPNGSGANTRNHIARLNADGSLDTTFNPNANDTVNALALQPDGKLVLAGSFTTLSPNGGGAITRNRIARLNTEGSLDMAFDPDTNNGYVVALALQPDGKLMLGGYFASLSPNGGSAVTRNSIARVNADGSLDMAFDPNTSAYIDVLMMQPDGKLLVGGDMISLSPNGGGAVTRHNIARLSTPQAALQSISIVGYTTGGSTITWSRAGAGAELALPPQLLFSLTGSTYASVGTMQRISNGWRYSGFTPPLNQNFYLRTRGQASSSSNSGDLIESTLQVYLSGNDGIFANGFD
ncbi:hypothetical protein ELE36_00985 [Pseudolysobacter antarcticus]|uniref:Delta-60 repeat domain-containing protein n=1 Tax=Pseudolysobacter antarcticus TaxID=2511995 RepID=A0A411HF16_9GAMM|nr:delta-60 repeat domain-containing protein [Pseudolysobacter antarcticus]QBB69067.1 hypothetical protein ELE36_00985 [Pseudolysobacter antarcticus]